MRRWLLFLYDFLGVENTFCDDRFDLHLGVSKAFGDFAVSLSEQRRGCPYCRVAAGEVERKVAELSPAEHRVFLFYDHGTGLYLLTHEGFFKLLHLAARQVNLG